MKTPTFIESWSTKRRVLTASACATVLVGGIVFTAIASTQTGDTKAPVIETSDGSVSNAEQVIASAEEAFNKWAKGAQAATPTAPAAAHCFFVVDATGFVTGDVSCGVVRVVGSNSGAYMDAKVTYSLSADTNAVVGSLAEPATFTLSTQTGNDASTLVRPDGLQPFPASILDEVMSQSASEMPVRLIATGSTAPDYSKVTIAPDDITWNPEIDNNHLWALGDVNTTVVKAGEIAKVTDPKTGITYIPDGSLRWVVIETKDSYWGSVDAHGALVGTYVGSESGAMTTGETPLPSDAITIIAAPTDADVTVFVYGNGYEVADPTVCNSPVISETIDNTASLVVAPKR